MNYDEAYNAAVIWLKKNPGEGRSVISSANGFVVVEDNRVLVEFKVSEEEDGEQEQK